MRAESWGRGAGEKEAEMGGDFFVGKSGYGGEGEDGKQDLGMARAAPTAAGAAEEE